MSTGSKKKRRIDRVTSLEMPPGVWGNLWGHLRRGHVLVRLALCGVTALLLWLVTRGWAPPLPYHLGDVPSREIIARTEFKLYDDDATQEAKRQARTTAIAIYEHNPQPLEQLRAKVENDVTQLVAAKSYDEAKEIWNQYRLQLAEGTPQPTEEERQQRFQKFREALSTEGALETFKASLSEALAPLMKSGILEKLPPEHDANAERIAIRPVGNVGFEVEVPISEVLVENAASALQKSLQQKMPLEVADRIFAELKRRLSETETLKLNLEATREVQAKAVAAVEDQFKVIPAGEVLARVKDETGTTLAIDAATLEKLEKEHATELAQRPFSAKLARSLAVIGMYVALYTLCGYYIYRREPRIINDLGRMATLLALVVATVSLMVLTSHDEWRVELIPLMLFGMTVAIAYQQEIALLLSAAVTLISVVALGHALSDAVVLLATTAGAILLLGRVRSRSKLLSVGFLAGGVAALTTIGVGTLEGEPILLTFKTALLWSIWAVIAGTLMTAILPMVERIFSVQTDLSLIELGDPSHQLLQELIRRAPGTYNHSITVASLAEAAAEAIGARSLLVRVGAYFHDIGKMLKPGYFAENQGQGDNRHRSLVPAMSTLVIIAHVKDGADLARQNRIPEPIIDFIQQHHGTTLVEYFYRQASESRKTDPNGSDVDESSFRYPGPKPQTKEAGILMLADAVESASRVLVEPTPARIESLVEDISRKRLLDGQFDECGLTLEEVRKINDSLVKSLTAVYHGRVKYPDQETA
ncbi:MAG TPA: HDIG domain-containing protein [Lacipirellulaceae bacterium]|nr:HDIG domain-containing protein [Lacipirellulaceae bacterium]